LVRSSLTACGVVLGAGSGSRFGGPKQLAELEGRPLVQWALDAACAATALERVVLVLGAHADAVEAAVSLGRAEIVRCPDWAEGIAASLRCSLDAAVGAEWVVVTLADEPRLPALAIERVVAAARAAPADIRAVRATWSGRPGHPVALNARLAPQLRRLRGDRGARDLIDDVPSLAIECDDLGHPRDVDTPEQLEELSL
jgi:CTP:molybdopterin cytidylyltransferase MocA